MIGSFILILFFCTISLKPFVNAAECHNKILYCFDMDGFRLGKIEVDQCWIWQRLR
jgi:hypothetical protein